MSSTYTNKKSETIRVSKEHLEVAYSLKLKLQRDHNKCPWRKHKQLMIEEGFYDSDSNESYRQMIKNYQKKIGSLPSATKYAEIALDRKLDSYRQIVGELTWEKQENQSYLRDIRKFKKEIYNQGILIEELIFSIRNVLSDIDFKRALSKLRFNPVKNKTGSRMIVCASDWHVGAMVDVEGNKYNLEVARRRVNDFVDAVILEGEKNGVTDVDFVFMGDAIEHVSMRVSQGFDTELTLSNQMTECAKLIIEALIKLSSRFKTAYCGYAGNHDRLNPKKEDNVHGDTAMVVINKMVEMFIEMSDIENLSFIETHKYHAKLLDINGRNFRFEHGDKLAIGDKTKLAKRTSYDGIVYDAIVYGHYHHYKCVEVGLEKWDITIGSLKGSDDYSETLGLGASPSQGIILVSSDGVIDVKRIKLK